ncbi:hypothetical protein [Paenibacillus spongiae]|uniref:hypothetical protein n=1 Tax=Paenibacillus spongiae TaxID=2909671 RepID=UPI0035A2542F
MPRVGELLDIEKEYGLDRMGVYSRFQEQAIRIKHELLSLFIQIKREGKTIAGYGAPAYFVQLGENRWMLSESES